MRRRRSRKGNRTSRPEAGGGSIGCWLSIVAFSVAFAAAGEFPEPLLAVPYLFPFGILSLVFGVLSRDEIRQGEAKGVPRQRGRGLATTAVVAGVLTIAAAPIAYFLALAYYAGHCCS